MLSLFEDLALFEPDVPFEQPAKLLEQRRSDLISVSKRAKSVVVLANSSRK